MRWTRVMMLAIGAATMGLGVFGVTYAYSHVWGCRGYGINGPWGSAFSCDGSCPPDRNPCMIYDPGAPIERCSCNAWVITCCSLSRGSSPPGTVAWMASGSCFAQNAMCEEGICDIHIIDNPASEDPAEKIALAYCE